MAFGSDWAVAPVSPIEGIDAAVNRRTIDGAHPGGWFPAQRINVAEAIETYTLGSAYDELDYNATGTLADYLVQAYQARAFVIELDPGPAPKGSLLGARQALFALPERDIRQVFETNIRPALALIDAAAGTKTGAELIKDYKKWKVAGKGNQLPG